MSTPNSADMASPPFPIDLPFSLASLLHFALSDPFTQTLAKSAANRFFDASYLPGSSPLDEDDGKPGQMTREARVVVRTTGDEGRGCWGLLPLEWREYFDGFATAEERMDMLKDLANGEREDFPPSLQAFLYSCRSMSFDRTCSPVPVLSYPPRPSTSSSSPADLSLNKDSVALHEKDEKKPKIKGERNARRLNVKNAMKAGQSDKKEHEVQQLSRLVQDLKSEAPLTHCVDVGSGRAHLSRALSSPPLNLHTLAIDWSSSQAAGAAKLDEIRSKAELGPTEGSLVHEVESLDEEGVGRALARWPPPPKEEEGAGKERAPPSLLVALHACGDLTPDAIKAFIRSDTEQGGAGGRREGARAIFVGCCYNLQTPSLFPLSSLIHSTASQPPQMQLHHLRLTPQSPPTWHLTPSSTAAFLSSTLKIAFRARFEAELAAAGVGEEDERRVGRVAEGREWKVYRVRAREKYDYGRTKLGAEEVPAVRFGLGRAGGEEGGEEEEETEWQTALFRLRVFWTLRSWLGPVLETLCVVDRFAFLCEGLRHEWAEEGAGDQDGEDGSGKKRKRRVELVNVFDQGTGSLRNLALVVR
ncbi:hypothetical protein JCM11251_006842 [Rhodosporidiobolus azoricus]